MMQSTPFPCTRLEFNERSSRLLLAQRRRDLRRRRPIPQDRRRAGLLTMEEALHDNDRGVRNAAGLAFERAGLRIPQRPSLWRRGLDQFKRPFFTPKATAETGDYHELLSRQEAAGTAQNTYTTAKSVINPQALYVVRAGFWRIGRVVRITVTGALSNIVTTPGTFVQQIMLGPTANIVAFTTGNIQLNATAHTLLPFWTDILLTCRAVGATTTANLMGMGRIQGIQPTLTAGQTDATNTGGIYSAPATAPAVGTGFDSTTASILDFWQGFSISNAGNGVTVHNYIVELLN